MSQLTLGTEDSLSFDSMCSFKTDNYTGIWEQCAGNFVLFPTEDVELYIMQIPECNNYMELDQEVYNLVEEHITDVWFESTYQFVLNNRS